MVVIQGQIDNILRILNFLEMYIQSKPAFLIFHLTPEVSLDHYYLYYYYTPLAARALEMCGLMLPQRAFTKTTLTYTVSFSSRGYFWRGPELIRFSMQTKNEVRSFTVAKPASVLL